MKPIDLESASTVELRQYARDELGLSVPRGASDEAIKKLITDTDETQAPVPKPVKVGKEPKLDQPRVKIHIMKLDGDTGNDDVYVGVNGKGYLIKRGEDVDVPVEVVEVLKNAVETRYHEQRDPDKPNKVALVRRDVHSYPFSIVG